MPARKMRVDLFDDEGNRYTVTFEGHVSRDKAIKLIDMVELLGGMPDQEITKASRGLDQAKKGTTKYEKVHYLLRENFPAIWFSSREAQLVYEQVFKEPISLSTISTYLARLSSKGFLLRAGSSNNLKYKLLGSTAQVAIKRQIL